MQPRSPLGRTGMVLTPIGLGTWAQGGGGWAFAWGPQDDRQSEAAIRRALEIGINWIDTAPAYGLGHAEELVGRVVASLAEADRPFVLTKAGRSWNPERPMDPLVSDLRPATILREVEDSLRRLRTERIDLLQVHWPPTDGTSLEEYWGTFLRLKEQGKVRAVGLSNHSAELLAEAERLGHVDSLQPPFSLIRREVAAAEIPWCAANGTGVIAYGPLQAGLLSGAMTPERVAAMPEDDWRRRNPEFLGDQLHRNLALAGALAEVGRRHGASAAAVAVAWVLAWPGMTGAIVGARRPDQLEDWEAASELRLGAEDLDEIARALEETGAGSGPVRPGTPG